MAKGSPRYSSDESSEDSSGDANDEYELLPTKRVAQLEKEVRTLKKNPLGALDEGKSLSDNMGSLSKSMNELIKIFKTASTQMDLEEKEAEIVSQQMGPLMEKIDLLIDQNKKIAKGLIAIADMVEEHAKGQDRIPGSSLSPSFRSPMMSQQPPLPPPPPTKIPLPIPPSQDFPTRPPSFPSNPFDDIPPIGVGLNAGLSSPPSTPHGGPLPPSSFPQPPPNMMPTSTPLFNAPQKKKGFF